MQWVYILVTPATGPAQWSVGFYGPPNIGWVEDSQHDDREDAAARVNYLNGGTGSRQKP